MTVSSDRGNQVTVDQLILRAYKRAGQINIGQGTASPQWLEKAQFGREELDTILDELQTEGVYARSVVFYNLSLTEDTYIYSMPATALDVVGDGMYIPESETDLTKAQGETVVKQTDRETWHRNSAKNAKSRPNLFWTDRQTTPISVRLWPIPDEAGTIRFQIHQKLADTLEGDATLELLPYWDQYLIYALATVIAETSSLPAPTCSYLNKRAEQKKQRARAFANQRPGNVTHLTHYTPWSR